MNRAPSTGCTNTARPIITKIVNKFQITVPGEIRALFGLKEGDVFEWSFNQETSTVMLVPKRAQLITPQLDARVLSLRTRRVKGGKTQVGVQAGNQAVKLPDHPPSGATPSDIGDEEIVSVAGISGEESDF